MAKGKNKINVATASTKSADELLGVGNHAMNDDPEQTVINETHTEPKVESKKQYSSAEERTTVHITKGIDAQLKEVYEEMGYGSKQEFVDQAVLNFIRVEKERLKQEGKDIDAYLKMKRQFNS